MRKILNTILNISLDIMIIYNETIIIKRTYFFVHVFIIYFNCSVLSNNNNYNSFFGVKIYLFLYFFILIKLVR
jgi:hypothetical protein